MFYGKPCETFSMILFHGNLNSWSNLPIRNDLFMPCLFPSSFEERKNFVLRPSRDLLKEWLEIRGLLTRVASGHVLPLPSCAAVWKVVHGKRRLPERTSS